MDRKDQPTPKSLTNHPGASSGRLIKPACSSRSCVIPCLPSLGRSAAPAPRARTPAGAAPTLSADSPRSWRYARAASDAFKALSKVSLRPGQDGGEVRLGRPLGARGGGRRRRALQHDSRPFGQHPQRLWKLDPLDLLHEIEDVAPRAATPALKSLALGIHFHRGVVVVMKGTKRLVTRARAAKLKILAHKPDDIHRVFYGGFSRIGVSGHRGLPQSRHEPGSMARDDRRGGTTNHPRRPIDRSPCPSVSLAVTPEL